MKKYALLLATLAFLVGCAKNSDMMTPKADMHISHQHDNNVTHEHKHATDMKNGCSMDKKCKIMDEMPKDHNHMHMMKGKMPKDHNHMHMMKDDKKPECACSKGK
ncbi:hypothetical protein [Campylobacter pinnipediorum]|uniref:Lipoprotein n=1 Tax=Campylobacter pinnipediorum subsp. pinnipediorum TaxID=1660067 RepID=A0AAX0LAU5_9BACT|nr:hypothetical protein [Campylobacter pinnipediorum]OPA77122.1 hypothetical protein BFG05_04180 [Campylobacter pinnipediorum subsp. pinnipediorum]OPA78909.1 hypothetical protein BFG04_02475 [Campylobacter pinnipediorum subsp. pinnipediorum]